jgi:nicotinamidase-related amidase
MPTPTLLVIDMLEDFFSDDPLAERRAELARSINELVRAFREHGSPVVWVRQEFSPDLNDAFLDMRRRNVRVTIAGTEGAEILPELDRADRDAVVVKKRYSAFFGTPLEDLLRDIGTDLLVVAGVNTHACVRTTVIDAYQRDLVVVLAEDSVASYDAEHHEVTRRYLDGKIAFFTPNAEILRCLAEGRWPA